MLLDACASATIGPKLPGRIRWPASVMGRSFEERALFCHREHCLRGELISGRCPNTAKDPPRTGGLKDEREFTSR
jgi:hypothetical protein